MANNKYCGNVRRLPASERRPEPRGHHVRTEGRRRQGRVVSASIHKKQGKPTFEAAKAAIIADINERITGADRWAA